MDEGGVGWSEGGDRQGGAAMAAVFIVLPSMWQQQAGEKLRLMAREGWRATQSSIGSETKSEEATS